MCPGTGSDTEVLWTRQERVFKMDLQVHFDQKKRVFLSFVWCIKVRERRFESHCHGRLQNPGRSSAVSLCNLYRGKSTISAELLVGNEGKT